MSEARKFCHRKQVKDLRNPQQIVATDQLWKCNTPKTLKKVHKILNGNTIVTNQDKIEHGFDWGRFKSSAREIPSSLTANGMEDGITIEYRNPQKSLEPGIMDSNKISTKKKYKEGTHLFEINIKYISPIQYNSHIHFYIGIEQEQRENQPSQICRWWLSLTKMMLLQHYTKDARILKISQYPTHLIEMPQKLFIVLDMEFGTLGFIVDDKYLGPSFGGLCGLEIIPNISYYGNVDCDIKMEYIGAYHGAYIPSLKEISGERVHQLVRKEALSNGEFEELNLPDCLNELVQTK